MFKGGASEGWGRGILDIFTLCKEAGMPEPEYDFVHDNPGLNTKQIADILNKSPRTVEKHLTFLRTKSLIVHKDSDKTGGYYPL